MIKAIKKYLKFLTECLNSTADGIKSFNNSLDDFNVELEQRIKKYSIRMAAKNSKLNCLIIKNLLSEIKLYSDHRQEPLNRLYAFFEECMNLSERVEKSEAATDFVLSSSELLSWFGRIKTIQHSEDDYREYVKNFTKSGELRYFEKTLGNHTLSKESNIQSSISSEHLFINFALKNYMPETFNLKDLEIEIDKLFQEKSKISDTIFDR